MLTMSEIMQMNMNRSDIPLAVPGVTAVAYASGDQLGNPIVIDNASGQPGPIRENGLGAILRSLALYDRDKQSAIMDILFFNQNPVSLAAGDHSTFAPTAADLKNCIGVVSIGSADWIDAGANGGVANIPPSRLRQVLKPALGGQVTALYAVCVLRGAFTFANTTLQIRFQFEQGS